MTTDSDYGRILDAYPPDCQPQRIAFLDSAGGFSGARLWRLETPRGPACLRRWPAEQAITRLEFIQAALWHVDQEGFRLVSVPWETREHAGYVSDAGYLWELSPWMPGAADYEQAPSPAKLEAALTALAQFHHAAASFPLPEAGKVPSPGIHERLSRLRALLDGKFERLAAVVRPGRWPELDLRAQKLVELFPAASVKTFPLLESAAGLRVALQPCIRDIWHDHVLFVGSKVSGLVDFGAMRPENVAGDVARLLGSLAKDDREQWWNGLAAYQETRALSHDELELVLAFDRSTILMSGLQWLEWIYLQGRQFTDRAAVLKRLDAILVRLVHLAENL